MNLLPWYYRWLAMAAACAALFGFGYLKGALHEEAKYQAFVAQTKAEGEVAQKAAAVRIAADKLRKDNADVENKKTLAALTADNDRLRNARARGGYVPAAAPNSPNPNGACFDRAQLERAIQRLDGGIQSLIGKGDVAQVNLNTAKKWAVP